VRLFTGCAFLSTFTVSQLAHMQPYKRCDGRKGKKIVRELA